MAKDTYHVWYESDNIIAGTRNTRTTIEVQGQERNKG